MYTILAVAIGKPANDCTIQTKNDPILKSIRPYITGVINWLEKQPNPPIPDSPLPKYKIGQDYIIDYRECAENKLQSTFTLTSDIILCLSTTVARAAVTFTQNNNLATTPIVAIVSDYFSENFPRNVCGVSAKRPDHVDTCLRDFRADFPNAGAIYLLAKQGYKPSDAALAVLGSAGQPVYVGPNDNIEDQIHAIPSGSGGLLILPADRFFGAASDILQWAQNDQQLLTYWTVTDWVSTGSTGAFGGSGFSQQRCGQYLAERIASIWASNDHVTLPNPAWKRVDDSWYEHKKNAAVAKALKIKLSKGRSTKRTKPTGRRR
jgi:hypothetical protein